MKCNLKSEILFNAQRTQSNYSIAEARKRTLSSTEAIRLIEDTVDSIGSTNYAEEVKERKLLGQALRRIPQFSEFGIIISNTQGLIHSAAARFIDNVAKTKQEAVQFINTLNIQGTYSGEVDSNLITQVKGALTSEYTVAQINRALDKFLGNRLTNSELQYVSESKNGSLVISPRLATSINKYEYNRYLNDIGLLAKASVSNDVNVERQYEEGTSYLMNPPVIAHMNTQLAEGRARIRIMKQEPNYSPTQVLNIEQAIGKLEKRKKGIKSALTIDNLKGYLKDILKEMTSNIEAKVHLSDETLKTYLRSLALIKNAADSDSFTNNILNFSEVNDPDIINPLKEFAKQAEGLEATVNQMVMTSVINSVKDRIGIKDWADSEFSLVRGLNNGFTRALAKIMGIQHIKNPIVQYIYKKIETAAIAASVISTDVNNEIEEAYKAMLRVLPDTTVFYQKFEGVSTGRMTDVFSGKYWKVSRDFYNDDRERRNRAITLNPVLLFEKNLNPEEVIQAKALRKELVDNMGEWASNEWITEAKRLWDQYKNAAKLFQESTRTAEEFAAWELENSPIKRMANYGNKENFGTDAFLLVVPKKLDVDGEDLGYYDENFKTIMGVPEAAKFYNLVRTTFKDNQEKLGNYSEKLKPPTLAYIGQSVVDNMRKGDVSAAMKLVYEDLKGNYLVAKERAVPVKYPVDKITGEYQPNLQFEVHDIPTEVRVRKNLMLEKDAQYQELLKDDTIKASAKRKEIVKNFQDVANREVEAERSDDLLQSVVMANYAIQTYIQKHLIETSVFLAHHLIKNNIVHTAAYTEKTEAGNEGQKRLKEAIDHYIDVAYYDKRNLDATSVIGEIDLDNPDKKYYTTRGALHSLMSFGRVVILGWSAKLAVLNLGQQMFSNLMKAAEGDDFTFSDLMKGYKNISKSAKDRALIQKLFITGDLAYTYDKRTIHEQSKILASLHPMKAMTTVEKINQGSVSLAVMHFQKVINTETGEELSLYDALDDIGNLDEKYRHEQFGDLRGVELLATITADKIRPVVMKTAGDYISPLLIEKKEWGKALVMFKKFLPEMLMDRFEGRHYDYSLKKEVEGRMYGLGQGLIQIATGNLEELKADEVRLKALQGGLAEVTIAALVRIMFMSLSALSCDTKECREQRPAILFGLNVIGRLADDVLELTVPSGLWNNIASPFAIQGIVDNFIRFEEDFSAWLIPGGDTGRYKRKTRNNEEGDLKFTTSLKALIPFYRTNVWGINQFSNKLRYDPATYGWIGLNSDIEQDK